MELIDVYDENNNYLGYSLERSKIHKKNLWHRHVSAWIMNYNGDVLLQQRALIKKKNSGKWSKTGGHVESGETCEESIKREVYEEIGLEVNDEEIENIDIFKSINPNEHYYAYGYIFFTDYKEKDFVLQKEEVKRVKYYTIEEIEDIRKKDDKNYTFCDWNEEGFSKQISLLKEYREKIKNRNYNNKIIHL